VPHTLRYLAKLTGDDVETLAARLNANTEAVYGSWAEGLS
jgi:hypothetical protein